MTKTWRDRVSAGKTCECTDDKSLADVFEAAAKANAESATDAVPASSSKDYAIAAGIFIEKLALIRERGL